MTSTALQDIAKPANLRRAWNWISFGKLKGPAAGRVGNDGQSLESFQRRLLIEIGLLSSELKAGKFNFSQLDPVLVPKKDGKTRVICVPTVADRVVQRAILDSIGKKQRWHANSVNYGFVSYGGVERAATKAIEYRAQSPWVFKTDITKFFDNVDRSLLKKKVTSQVPQKSVHKLLFAAIDCEILATRPSHIKRIRQLGIREGRGVRQGMPLSPFFANLFLANFDKACEQRGLKALRYADDLIFFAASETEAKEQERLCRQLLADLDLQIPELVAGAKTQIYAPEEAAEFLGVELAPSKTNGYEVRVGQTQLQHIKTEICSLGSLAELKSRNLDVARFGNSLAARVAAYISVYHFCANSGDLQHRLEAWAKATRLEVAKALGIRVAELSPEGRWFLGI